MIVYYVFYNYPICSIIVVVVVSAVAIVVFRFIVGTFCRFRISTEQHIHNICTHSRTHIRGVTSNMIVSYSYVLEFVYVWILLCVRFNSQSTIASHIFISKFILFTFFLYYFNLLRRLFFLVFFDV